MLSHDIRFAARTLRRRPAFTFSVVATLGLCIGATTAVFSIVQSTLLDGLPYARRDRLVAVWSTNQQAQNDHYQLSVGDYYDYAARARAFSSLAAYFPTWNATYTAPDVAERIDVGVVSSNFLRTLGVRPSLGRDFAPGEDKKGAPDAVILTHAFFERVFHGDQAIVGRTITLEGRPFVVAGVLGADFVFPASKVDVLVPLPMLGSYLDRREVHLVNAIGRLRDGASLEQARTELRTIAAALLQEHPTDDAGLGANALPLADDLLGGVRKPITLLFVAVCAVLLIGCVNVTNLMLARANSRRQELAVRVAMGARPSAIQRQLLVESTMIALASGVLGIGIAIEATRAMRGLLPVSISRIGGAEIDGRVLAFTLLTCVLVAFACGVAPAWRAARNAGRVGLSESGRGNSASRHTRRFHDALVVGELAVAIVLSVTAGLLINSFAHVMRIDPGFRTSHIVRAKITLGDTYERGARSAQFFATVLRETRALSGVRHAGYVNRFPLRDGNVTTSVIVEGSPVPANNQYPSGDLRVASDGYFETMHIPVITGRTFSPPAAADSGTLVIILNRTAALAFLHSTNVVGKRLQLTNRTGPFFTIIGVVGDVRDASLREPPHAQLFLSSWQAVPSTESLVIEYDGAVESTLAAVRRIVGSLDKTLPLYGVTTVEETIAAATVGDRFTMMLLTGFAGLALLLAAIGTYSVIAYGVAERTREIGVRIALGAKAGEVLVMIGREGMTLFAVALPIALVGIWWAERAVAGLLFDVGPMDPMTIVLGVAAMAAATGVAAFVPARRAGKVDPMTALRDV